MSKNYKISQLKIEPVKNEDMSALTNRLRVKAARVLSLPSPDCIEELTIIKKSIDARKKNDIVLIFTISVTVSDKIKIKKSANVEPFTKTYYHLPEPVSVSDRPVITGFGPAGIFAAYILSLCGVKPIVIERGEDCDARTKTVEGYWKGEKLKSDSNVQFGEGGAGAFSDGKLNTGVKDKAGRISFVLDTLVKFGAPAEITYEQHPHVGTDRLKDVIKNLRTEIIKNGGTILFNTRLTDIVLEKGKLSKIIVDCEKTDDLPEFLKKYIRAENIIEFPVEKIILSTGHSARDTFRMLYKNNLKMEAKPFACGFRFIHSQELINTASYGEKYRDYFGAAPYKLTHNTSSKRGVYSFCMCPGGYVVDSSSQDGKVCVNGMSYYKRDSGFANSAIVVTVDKEDYKKALTDENIPADENDALLGMYYQELLEKKTSERGEGAVPVTTFMDFKNNADPETVNNAADNEEINENINEKINVETAAKAIKGRFKKASLNGIFSREIDEAVIEGITAFGKKISGFDSPDTLMAGCEMRTSSPVRIIRDENFEASVKGIFPCGEGAGYAGGIVSAAVDGIKVAEAVLCNYKGK